MSEAVIVLIIAIGVGALLSVIVWLVHLLRNRREPSLLECLDSIVDREGLPVGPSSGITDLRPMRGSGPSSSSSDDVSGSPDRADNSPDIVSGTTHTANAPQQSAKYENTRNHNSDTDSHSLKIKN